MKKREAGILIAKIHQLSGRLLAQKLKEYHIDQINPAQGRILFVLWENDGISIQELAKKTSLGKSTLTSMLDRLEEIGHLIRIPSKDDRRKIIIRLTEKDKALQDIYNKISREITDIFYTDLPAKKIDEFEEVLRKIFSNLIAFEKNSKRRK